MEKVYYNVSSPFGLSSVDKLSKGTNKSKNEVTKWLSSQDTYTLHRPVRKHFLRNPYFVSSIDKQWQADLADVSKFKQTNDNYRFLLICIDIFSRYLFIEPLKSKDSSTVSNALEQIFKKRRPQILMTDKGREFVNSSVQRVLSKHGILFMTSNNPDVKCSIVERVIRTLRDKISKFMTYTRKPRYIHILQDVVKAYNNSKHRTLGMAPSQVNIKTSKHVLKIHYNRVKNIPLEKPKYKEGDFVRVSREKGIFEKGSQYGWSKEIFKIKSVIPRRRTVYKLVDLYDEDIEGTWYTPELQKLGDLSNYYHIEKVLRRRGKGKKKEIFVKWDGFPNKFNSWIPATNIIK